MSKLQSSLARYRAEIKSREESFLSACSESEQKLAKILDSKYQTTNKILNEGDSVIINLKTQTNNHKTVMRNNIFRTDEIQKWIQIKKMLLDLQKKQLQWQKGYHEDLQKTKDIMIAKHKSLMIKQNQRKLRMENVNQFIKSCQAPNKSGPQSKQRGLYTPKSHHDPGFGIRFKPQTRELVFRIQTFDRKVAEFILFYDEQENRYGLKNPLKNLQSNDLLAVKHFNVHNDELKLYQQLRAIVTKHIDEGQDELRQA